MKLREYFRHDFIIPALVFFVIQPVGNDNYDYTNNGLLNMGLTFNGTEVFTTETTDALYMGSLQPYVHYTNYPTRQLILS